MSSCAEQERGAGVLAARGGLAGRACGALRAGLARACLLPVLLVVGLPWASFQAHSQAMQGEASPYQQCLTPAPGGRTLPAYPENRLQRKEGARFEVELRFVDSRRGPQVRLLGDFTQIGAPQPDLEFVAAVEAYAKQLRVPCLPDGDVTVSLWQRFQFIPEDGGKVIVGRLEDADQGRRASLAACIHHTHGQQRADYPARAEREFLQGTVMARFRFTAADAPPEVEIVAEPPRGHFGRSVRQYARGLRMPCLESGEYVARNFFTFRVRDGRRVVLRDAPLGAFVGRLRSFPAPAFIDTNAMRCPFELRLTYYAPHAYNHLEQLGEPDPARQPLLEWLEEAELDLPPDQANLVLGDSMKLQVPCVKLDVPKQPS